MQCIVEWEKWQLKKSQTVLVPIFVPRKMLFMKTGFVTALVILVIVSHFWFGLEFSNGRQSPTFFLIKVIRT